MDQPKKKCSDWPLLTESQVNGFLSTLPKWSLIKDISSVEGQVVFKLKIKFLTTNFVAALDFIQKAGVVAEAQGHHPGMLSNLTLKLNLPSFIIHHQLFFISYSIQQ